ncbi:bifunctional alpha/beta hydrolase/class I SAM-dependent methyltransferase [soil metagenome]
MQMTEHAFTSWDGATIFFRAWLPATQANDAILLFHRGHEHSGRWDSFANSLALDGVALFAWDQRGHGRSSGERGCAPDLAAIIRDADRFARHVAHTHGIATRDTAVIASSLGAVVATAWVHDYAPPVRALVLAAAAFEVKLYVPLAIPFLKAKEKLLHGGFVKSFVKSSMLTGVPEEQKTHDADPLIFKQISINLLLDLHHTGKRLVDDAAAITTPTLVLVAGKDWVVRRKPQLEFFRKLGSTIKQLELYPAGRHALFNDIVGPQMTQTIRGFLEQRFTDGDPVVTDFGVASRTEYDLLRMPSNLKWRAMQCNLKLGGLFSQGIRLGLSTGFDSGQSLDYVYQNKAAGLSPIGKMIDRGYLDAIGWRGIRVRRKNLRELLRTAIEQTAAAGREVRILDIAAGPGRYVLETLAELNGLTKNASAELRDYRQANLDAATALAQSLGVKDVTFKLADAFDRQSVADTSPRPAIAIASGIYELFADNEVVQRSLAGIADALVDDGYLIYTGQPWHPQVEFIARTLVNREGKPWIMRRRSQAELDSLIAAAGFEKVDQLVDRWGIFTVSLARRIKS